MKRLGYTVLFASLLLVGGCVTEHSVHVAPIQLEPIQVTMDVNVHIQDNQTEDAADAGVDAAPSETPAEDTAGGETP